MKKLYLEMSDEELDAYTKLRCDEVKCYYDKLRKLIMDLSEENDKLKKFNILYDIGHLLEHLSYEHVDTLDRYLYAYEGNKRLENIIAELKYQNKM